MIRSDFESSYTIVYTSKRHLSTNDVAIEPTAKHNWPKVGLNFCVRGNSFFKEYSDVVNIR